MRRAIAAFFLNLYHFFVPTATPDPVSRNYAPKPLHPRLLAALLGVSRIDDREVWEHCDHSASQVRDGYQEVEALCGQICLSTRDLFHHLHLDTLGLTGDRHKNLVDLLDIRLSRADAGPVPLRSNPWLNDPAEADANGMIILDREVMDESIVTKTVVTYGNPTAVAANLEELELLLRRGEVQEFGICIDGLTYYVVLQRGELEVVICSRS